MKLIYGVKIRVLNLHRAVWEDSCRTAVRLSLLFLSPA